MWITSIRSIFIKSSHFGSCGAASSLVKFNEESSLKIFRVRVLLFELHQYLLWAINACTRILGGNLFFVSLISKLNIYFLSIFWFIVYCKCRYLGKVTIKRVPRSCHKLITVLRLHLSVTHQVKLGTTLNVVCNRHIKKLYLYHLSTHLLNNNFLLIKALFWAWD